MNNRGQILGGGEARRSRRQLLVQGGGHGGGMVLAVEKGEAQAIADGGPKLLLVQR